jgi:predicted transcriptional regulator
MAEQDSAREVDLDRVVRIVSRYVQHHQMAPDQLLTLIVEVRRALAGLGRATPVQQPPRPVVPVRRSVQQDYVVCLECGYRGRTLRRHLRVAHSLDVAGYRTRWDLPTNHPLIAPSYSARRSTLAKQIGLGRKPDAVAARRAATGRRRPQRRAPEG